jgi:REP element-mobilizing transposase RayT
LEGALYYVTLEGPANEPIFKDQADYTKYVELLNTYKAEYGFKLFSYALLPSRLHLLIEPHEEFPISHIMQKLTPTYTKYYNHRYDRKGPLFQKRFRSVIVEKEAHLAELTRYIHKLSSRSELIRDLNEYSCTSLSAYTPSDVIASAVKQSPSLDLQREVAEVAACLPKDVTYARYFKSASDEDLNVLDRKLARGAIMGSDEFVAQVRERMMEQVNKDAESAHEPAVQMPVEAAPAEKAASVRPMTFALSGGLLATVAVCVISIHLANRTFVTNLPAPQMVKPAESTLMAPRGPLEEIKRSLAELTDLNGTVWEVELVSVGVDGVERPIKDQIVFSGKSFESHYFSSQGFSPSNYTVTINHNGVVTWETMQRNDRGETIVWRGDWNGKKMEGVMSYRPAGQSPQDFSFMSNQLRAQK